MMHTTTGKWFASFWTSATMVHTLTGGQSTRWWTSATMMHTITGEWSVHFLYECYCDAYNNRLEVSWFL